MALIKCPECNSEVSDKAESCPKCAYPIIGSIQAHDRKVQTIEQTSKRYKGHQLLSVLLFIISFLIMITGVSKDQLGLIIFGALGSVGGFIWYIIVKFQIWWHHA